MKTRLILSLIACVSLLSPLLRAAEEPVDFDKARQIFERRQKGEAVTAEEEAYVRRAMAERQRQQAAGNPGAAPAATKARDIDMEKARGLLQRRQAGEKLSAEDDAYLQRAMAAHGGGARPGPQPKWTGHMTPLTELGQEKYKGEDGGLYGGGRNDPPKPHLEAALKESAKIRPLDAEGNPSDDGKIGLVSVGMSNTTQEYGRFMQLANADPAKSRKVVLLDGAQGGQTAMRWANASAPLWQELERRMVRAGLTAKQVQVAWMKQAEAGPAQYGEFPQHARQLQGNLAKSLVNLKDKFPNLRIVYLSSRIYGGYATTGLNPEPYAYEGAFAMRWLIQDQIAGKPELNHDAARGAVKSPLLLWGPYLWADGETPRKADGLRYSPADLTENDGTHPTASAGTKVGNLLLDFLKTDATAKGWFTGK